MRTDEGLDSSGLEAVLSFRAAEGQRLPTIEVDPSQGEAGDGVVALQNERVVYRRITGDVGVAGVGAFVGAVGCSVIDDRGRDPISDGVRSAPDGRSICDIVSQSDHAVVESGQRGGRVDRKGVALFEHSKGGEADGFITGLGQGVANWNGGGFVVKIANHGRIIGGPGIPHGNREVEEIPRVDSGSGEVDSDCGKIFCVPLPRDGLCRAWGGGENTRNEHSLD